MSVFKHKRKQENRKTFKKAFLSLIFALLSMLILLSTPVSAITIGDQTQQTQTTQTQTTQNQNQQTGNQTTQNANESSDEEEGDTCYSQTGAIGWLVCPTTGVLAKAIDGIYSIITSLLVVRPISTDSTSPIYQVWGYFRGVTNIVFIIFILIIIFSQLTGIGISNYGIKNTLPKIIIAAILVNLSYIICSLAVDLSNIIGASLRDVFANIEEKVVASGILAGLPSDTEIKWADLVSLLLGGGTIAGFAVALSGGLGALFWVLVPVLLGAVASIVIALITIASRQAFISLLIMISPLAFVCYLLPNTEGWFKKWKDMLFQMLVFYPTFSVLYGASSLAGWVLIASARNALELILGMAVKIVPLVVSWSLLKMSGTIPGQVSSLLHNAAAKPLKAAADYSSRKRELSASRYLGVTAKKYDLPRRTAQWLDSQKTRDLVDIETYKKAAKDRGVAAASKYKRKSLLDPKKTVVTRRGRDLYSVLSRDNIKNQRAIQQTKNDFNKGISDYAKGTRSYDKLLALDLETRDAADDWYMEIARGEMIDRDNAELRHNRFESALSAHSQLTLSAPGRRYNVKLEDVERYNRIKATMEGDSEYIHYAGAYTANAHALQDKIIEGKFSHYFDSIPATQEVVNRLTDLTNQRKSNAYIDTILTGMRTLNLRGDTDLIKDTLDQVLAGDQVKLGTHASQAIANFLMFDVKDNDPFLRRFGKYINLETAAVYNEGGNRKNEILTFDEYVRGEYPEIDPTTGKAKRDADGNIVYAKSKRDVVKLMEGTSLNGVERTAYDNMDKSLRKAYTNADGTVDTEGMARRRQEIQNSMLPAFISAGLSYPSGSEQIQSQASFLTGLKLKNGKWIKRWEDPDDALYGIDPAFFQARTDEYVNAQTSSQILNLRTDLLLPLTETFADERIEQLRAAGELPPNFGSMSEEDLKNFRKKCAKERFQELLDKKDQLEQIYKTRRSGAALGTKGSVLEMLDFNDEVKVNKYLKKKANERKERIEEAERRAREESGDDAATPPPTYENHNYFIDVLTNLFDINPDDPDFYSRAHDKLEEFGLDYIAHKFAEYHRANPTASNDDLMELLNDLLNDIDNYE